MLIKLDCSVWKAVPERIRTNVSAFKIAVHCCFSIEVNNLTSKKLT